MRKNKLISIVCALSMLITMMGSFVVVNAESTKPTVKLEVTKSPTNGVGDYAEVTLSYENFTEGTILKSIDAYIPIDSDKLDFELIKANIGDMKYVPRDKSLVFAFAALSEAAYVKDTSGVLATFKVTVKDGVPEGEKIDLILDSSTFTTATGDMNIGAEMTGVNGSFTAGKKVIATPTPAPIPQGAYVMLNVTKQPSSVGDYAEVTLSYANMKEGTILKSIDAYIPFDTEKADFELIKANVGDMKYVPRDKSLVFAFAALSEAAYVKDTSGVLATFKIIPKDNVALGDKIELVLDSSTFTTATGDMNIGAEMTGVNHTIVVGSGGVTPPTPVDPVITGVTVDPATAEVVKGGSKQFTAAVQGTNGTDADGNVIEYNKNVTWTVTGGVEGTSIDQTGLLTVSANETAAALTVTATSVGDTTKTGTANVTVTTVTPPSPRPAVITGVTITPASATLAQGESKTFVATVQGTDGIDNDGNVIPYDKTVVWSVEGANSATTTAVDGVLKVAADETATSIRVIATSNGDATKKAEATVTILEKSTFFNVTTEATATGYKAKITLGDKDISELTAQTITVVGDCRGADNTTRGSVSYDNIKLADFLADIEAGRGYSISLTGFGAIDNVIFHLQDENGNIIR